jgi:hypothetical protein
LWAQLFTGQDGASRTGLRTFQAAFRTAVATSEGEEALRLGGGGWEIDLRGGAVRTVLATAFIADFLDQVRRAGLADPAGDGRLVLRPPDNAKLRISVS